MRRPQPGPGECRHCFRVHDCDEMCWPAGADVRTYGDPESDDWSGTTDRLESFVLDITNPHQDTRRGAHGFQVEEAKRVAAWLRGGLADGTLTVDDLIPAAAVPVVPEEPAADWHCEGDAVGIYWEGICSPGNPIHSSPCGPIPPAPAADVEPQPAPVDVLAMPEWAALVEAVNDDSGTVGYYRANVTGKASALVRAARSAAGSTEA